MRAWTLQDAIDELDRYLGHSGEQPAAPPDVLSAWLKVRGEARRGRRVSSTTLPSVSTAVQHVEQAKVHAEAAMEALGHITTGRSEPPPDGDGF